MTIEELYRDTFSRSKNDQNTAMQSLITGIKYFASVSVVFYPMQLRPWMPAKIWKVNIKKIGVEKLEEL